MNDSNRNSPIGNVADNISKAMEVVLKCVNDISTDTEINMGSKKDGKRITQQNTVISNDDSIDIALIVAVQAEFDGVCLAFDLGDSPYCEEKFYDDYKFMYTPFQYAGFNIALVLQERMGMVYAASLTTRVALALKPKLIAMVGVCGGKRQKAKLGDIVIASSTLNYTEGKFHKDAFKPRTEQKLMDNTLAHVIQSKIINSKKELGQKILKTYSEKTNRSVEIPSIHYAPIVSGPYVIDNKEAKEQIDMVQDDYLGIDMETYAVAASSAVMEIKWIVIKSIQDFGDGNKTSDENSNDIREFAAYASAKLFKLNIETIMGYIQ